MTPSVNGCVSKRTPTTVRAPGAHARVAVEHVAPTVNGMKWLKLLSISLAAAMLLLVMAAAARGPSAQEIPLTPGALRSWAEELVRDTLDDALQIQEATGNSWVKSLVKAAHSQPGGSRYLDVVEGNLLFENFRLEPHLCLMGWIGELGSPVVSDCELAEYPRLFPDDEFLLGPV